MGNVNFTIRDLSHFAMLDMTYNKMRHIQANHDKLRTKCKGSGMCCQLGLQIPILECANIAFHIKREFYLRMERYGIEEGEKWYQSIIDNLISRMYDNDWSADGHASMPCVFYDNGCTVYEYRPYVCRAYGTIVTVDSFCPRERLANGGVDIFSGEAIKDMVNEFDSIVYQYNQDHQEESFVVYMPLGILKFLLPDEAMRKLAEETDEKFWVGHPVYRTYFMERYADSQDAEKKS